MLKEIKTNLSSSIRQIKTKLEKVKEKQLKIKNELQESCLIASIYENLQPIEVKQILTSEIENTNFTLASINRMNINELQSEIRKRKRSLKGSRADLKKRLKDIILTDKKIYRLTEEDKLNLVYYYGTRISAIVSDIDRVLTDSQNRIIVHCDYPEMLDRLNSILDKMNISCRYIKGNANRRTRVIEDFQKDKVNIIFFCCPHDAIGFYWDDITHIIFAGLYPTNMNSRGVLIRRVTFNKASTRPPVTIIRYIIQNTEEHQRYLEKFPS